MKINWNYIWHWFGYCYYRCVGLYSKEGEEPEYFEATIPFYVFFIAIDCLLDKIGITLAENKVQLLPYAVALAFVLPLFFNKKKYENMKVMFGDESKKSKIILGILAAVTFVCPLVLSVVYYVS